MVKRGLPRRYWRFSSKIMNLPFLKFFPESSLKNFLRSIYFGYRLRNFARVSYKKGVFYYKLRDGRVLKSYFSLSDSILIIEKGYLKYYKPKKGDIIIDGGSYPGDLSLYLSKLVGPSGKIYAFEPDKKNYDRLIENLKLNEVKNVFPVNEGLWNKKDILKMSGDDYAPSIGKEGEKVNVISIDEFAKKKNIKSLSFIKMDIEGAEIEALEGAKKSLNKFSPQIAIASYHIRDGKKTCGEVEKILNKLNYLTLTSFKRHLTTYAKKK